MITEASLKDIVDKVLNDKEVCGLQWMGCFDSLEVETKIKGDKFAIVIDFFTEDYKDRAVYINLLSKCEEKEIIDWANNLSNEVNAISKLNKSINKDDNDICVIYKWTQNDKECSIDRWDSDDIVIKLNRSAIEYLKSDLSSINSLGIGDYRNSVEFVKNFNEADINKAIGASIPMISDDIHATLLNLSSNMLSFRDILDNVNTDSKGVHSFDGVVSIEELGIIGVYKINVDYGAKTVKVDIDNSLIDVSSCEFSKNSELVNGIISEMESQIKNRLKWI